MGIHRLYNNGYFMRDKLDSLFKAYDVRGVYPEELDDCLSYDIGVAFGLFVKEPEVIIGHDARLSSEKIFLAFSSGLRDSGKGLRYIGLVPTDVVYTMSGIFDLPGVMITASHNPKEWNGFKFCKAGSKPVGIETGLNEIKGLINPSNSYEEISPVNQEDIFDEYVNHVSAIINPSRINKEMNIGIDAGNGVAGAFIPKLLERYGVSFSGIFLEPDGNFPNHPADPSNQKNLNDLLEHILKNNLDFGVAFDGDADRAVFLDNKGNLISGSMMTAVISDWLFLKNKELKVVHNVNVSPSMVDYLTSKGVTMIRSKVGHSYIKEVMHNEQADFGGEHSAHFYYKDNYYADSGMITLLMFIQILSEKKVKASELITGYNFRPSSGEINFEVADTKESLNKIEEFFEGSFDKLDGLTYLSDDYWFNVRGSNTEPKLRLNAEAVNQETLDDIITQIKNIIGE